MIRAIVIGLVTGILNLHQTHAQGVKFREDLSWEQIKQVAKEQNKLIFADVMATWCGPCKAMEQSVYPDTALGNFLKDKFVAIKVQVDKTTGDSEFVKSWYDSASQISREYQATGLPSLLFLSPEGKLLYKSVGFRNAAELIADAKKAMDPASQYESMLGSYFAGKLNESLIDTLIARTEGMGRKIMAQNISFEKKKSFREETAYAALANLSTNKASDIKIDFTGSWKIDYPACEFGDQPLRIAAKEFQIQHSANGLSIVRLSSNGKGGVYQSKEQVTVGGKISTSEGRLEPVTKHSRIFATADGLTEFSEVSLPNDKSIDYVVTENWSKNAAGQLLIEKTVYHNNGQYSVKLVYNKLK